MNLSIPLDPILQTGLTVTAKVRNYLGTQVGATVTLTEGDAGFYTGTYSLVGVANGQYSVVFLDNATGKIVGAGEFAVVSNSEVTQSTLDLSVKSVAGSVWEEAYASHTSAGTFGKLLDNLRKSNLAIDGVVTGTPTASVFDTDLDEPTGTHDHQLILFTSGALTGYSRPISTFTNGTDNTITLQEPLPAAPQAGDEFVILPQHVHPISEIQNGLATLTALGVVNQGVKNASILVPHTSNI